MCFPFRDEKLLLLKAHKTQKITDMHACHDATRPRSVLRHVKGKSKMKSTQPNAVLSKAPLRLRILRVCQVPEDSLRWNSGPTNGAEVVASKLEAAARLGSLRGVSASGPASGNGSAQGLSEMLGGGDRSPQRAGSVRLRDAIVWGYMMQRHDNRAKVCHAVPVVSSFVPWAAFHHTNALQ